MLNTKSAAIKLVGIGNCGCTILEKIMQAQFCGIDFIACATDPEILCSSSAQTKILLRSDIKERLRDSSFSESLQETIAEFKSSIAGSDAVILVAGFGGTSTNATPLIAEAAISLGILTIGIVIMPFTFEGKFRSEQAEFGIAQLRELGGLGTVYVVSNDNLCFPGFAEKDIQDVYRAGDGFVARILSDIINNITENSFTDSDLEEFDLGSDYTGKIGDFYSFNGTGGMVRQ